LVANFTTTTVGLIDSITLVVPQRLPTLSVDVLARGRASDYLFSIPLEDVAALVLTPGLLPSQAADPTVASGAQALLLPTDPTPLLAAQCEPLDASPVLPAAARLGGAPMVDTPWRGTPSPSAARRSSWFARGDTSRYISIVDRAMLRRKEINEGSSLPVRHRGELDANDLLAVAMEDGHPLPREDV
jgi:hypothetical protein